MFFIPLISRIGWCGCSSNSICFISFFCCNYISCDWISFFHSRLKNLISVSPWGKLRKSMMSLILTFIDNFITEGFSSSLASKFCYNQSISILNSLLRFEFRGWQAFKLVKEDIKFWMSHLTTRNNLNPETAEKPVEKPRPLLSTSRCNIILICNKEQWIIVFILS